MYVEALWKKLKRRLKMRRQWLHFAGILLLLSGPAAATAGPSDVVRENGWERVAEHLKAGAAYFGVDREGRLVLFDGPPQDDRTVRTFFQLDIERMESSLPPSYVEELKRGIRVTDLDEYNSVLSTLADFAKETAGQP